MIFLIYTLILIVLVYISYKDYKQRIIPDFAVLLVFIFSSFFYFAQNKNIVQFLFYIFLISVPMLLIGYLADIIQTKRIRKADAFIIIISVTTGVLIPSSLQVKFVTACAALLISMILEMLIFKNNIDDMDETSNLGGGDIKLVAALGPVLQEDSFIFLFISFLLAYIFMKLKKEKNIYLAPFMSLAFLVIFILRLLKNNFTFL